MMKCVGALTTQIKLPGDPATTHFDAFSIIAVAFIYLHHYGEEVLDHGQSPSGQSLKDKAKYDAKNMTIAWHTKNTSKVVRTY